MDGLFMVITCHNHHIWTFWTWIYGHNHHVFYPQNNWTSKADSGALPIKYTGKFWAAPRRPGGIAAGVSFFSVQFWPKHFGIIGIHMLTHHFRNQKFYPKLIQPIFGNFFGPTKFDHSAGYRGRLWHCCLLGCILAGMIDQKSQTPGSMVP
jgi:hypothetical protein